MSALLHVTFLSFFSAVQLVAAAVPKDKRRSVSIESSSHLADVAGHSDAGGHSIRQQGEGGRIVLNTGTTLMEGSSLGEASGRPSAGLIRRAPSSAPHRSATAAETASSVLEEARIGVQDLQTYEATSRAVTWQACTNGKCQCHSRRRVVIRYQREPGLVTTGPNVLTNWWTRQRACTGTHACPYTQTSLDDFNKGFVNASNLRMCGGDGEWSKDCLEDHEPQACSFASDDKNPYDAKEGEYCCSGQMQYCSYRCSGDEEFLCPSSSKDKNFPGGMDPAGPGVFKKCYMAQYPHGSNPEVASDAEVDADDDEVKEEDLTKADNLDGIGAGEATD